MKNSQYTYPLQCEIFRQGLQVEIEKTKEIIEKKVGIIKSLESLQEPTAKQVQYCETLRNECKQHVALIDQSENICESFVENLGKLSKENIRLSQEIEKLKALIRSQESQILVLKFIIERKKGKEAADEH